VKPKKAAIFSYSGQNTVSKTPYCGKDRAAGKVLAGKSVHSALLWFVGSKGRMPARRLL